MKNKIYILSNSFDYANTISPAAGPYYAKQMGWKTDNLNNIQNYTESINIIDNKMTEIDCFELEQHISKNLDTVYLMIIVDPFYHHNENWYYLFLDKIKKRNNVLFLSKYRPSEWVEDLNVETNRSKLVVVPHPFFDPFKISNNFDLRAKKIIYSGALNSKIYPLRTKILDAKKSNPLLWNKIEILTHPGYPDVGDKVKHDIIGKKYYEYLSKYYFMFIDPSRCNIEFLKYTECAYAHCVPVGKVPDSFTPEMKNPFFELDFGHLYFSIRKLFSMSLTEVVERSRDYYNVMQKERNPDVLNSKLDAFLSKEVGL